MMEFQKRDLDEAYPLVHALHQRIQALSSSKAVGCADFALLCDAITGVVPAYTTVTVFYDPLKQSYREVVSHLQRLLEDLSPKVAITSEPIEIPVCYGGEFGPDLHDVAQYAKLSEEEVIQLHTAPLYTVYMIGFAPGFPYLGGLDARISMPRRDTPRVSIPAGSVGIAGAQTGVYPNQSPGGWQVIGRTPVRLFDPHQDPPSLLQAGQLVRFCPMTSEEYLKRAAADVMEGASR